MFKQENAGLYMARALEIGKRGRGRTSPNPNVGAVVVNQHGVVVGEGFCQPPGGPHAEIVALRQAGDKARGGILFTTLEPCRRQGRTPPCTEAIIKAGIKEVYFAVEDPNPKMAGGAYNLRQELIHVHSGLMAEEANQEHEAFFKWIKSGTPFVTLVYALALDGQITFAGEDDPGLTSEASRLEIQRWRDDNDVIITGVGTILAHDPALNVTLAEEEQARRGKTARQPLRVILDGRGQIPLMARVISHSTKGNTMLATSAEIVTTKSRELEQHGVEVLVLPPGENGKVSLLALLAELGKRGYLRVLVESNAETVAAVLAQNLADRIEAFIVPKILGGHIVNPTTIMHPLELEKTSLTHLGSDLLLGGYPAKR